VVLTERRDLIGLVLGGRIVLWNVDSRKITDTVYELREWPGLRCNDARVDPSGVLWFGTMQNNVQIDGTTAETTAWEGGLYSLTPGGQARLWRSGLGIANTLAWSPDTRTMYFGDTLANCIFRADFDVVGSYLNKSSSFFRGFERGLPDGSAVDAEGYLWNCRYGGGCIVRIAPNGAVATICEMPVSNPTTCAFGGRDLKTLFITSAADGSTSGGAMFSLSVPVEGLPSIPMKL
jgi:sugar lactone lactonase YvrE